MKRLRGCLMVVFIFACGFLVGGFLGAAVGWTSMFNKMVKGGPTGVRDLVLERAFHDLRLQPDQKVQVRKIVEETGTELAAATSPVRPQVEEIFGRSEDRIRETLNEKQRAKFDGFVNQARRRWKAAAGPSPSPFPPPPARLEATPPASPPERGEAQLKDL